MEIIITSIIVGLACILVTQFVVEQNHELSKDAKDMIVLSSATTAMVIVLAIIIASDIILYLM